MVTGVSSGVVSGIVGDVDDGGVTVTVTVAVSVTPPLVTV